MSLFYDFFKYPYLIYPSFLLLPLYFPSSSLPSEFPTYTAAISSFISPVLYYSTIENISSSYPPDIKGVSETHVY